MHRLGDLTVLSPSDLSNHLACRHLSYLNYRAMNGGPKPPKSDDALTEILQKYGEAHEQRYLQALTVHMESIGRTVIDLDEARASHGPYSLEGITARATSVAEAFRRGNDALYQPTFFREDTDVAWIGRADFLVATETASNIGDYSFEPYDTKLARIAKVNALLQLCSYAEHIAELQGTPPEHVHIVTGSATEGTVSVRLSEVSAYFRHVKEAFQQSLLNGFADATEPTPVEHCSICAWGRVCDKTWRDADDVTFVAGVTNAHRDVLRASGVTTLPELAAATTPPEEMNPETFARLVTQAGLQVKTRAAQRKDPAALPVYEYVRPIVEWRGFNLLPEPSPGDIFYDIEGHPYRGDEGLEYLHGLTWTNPDGTLHYEPIWAHDPNSERAALVAVIDHIYRRIAMPGFENLRVYHFGHYEPSALRRLSTRYAVEEARLDALFREGRFVDLSRVTSQGLRIGVESYSLKRLEALYGFRRDDLVAEGSLSIVQYEQWLNSRDTPEHGPDGDVAILDELAKYNRNDCESTLQLRTWLEERRADLRPMLSPAELAIFTRRELRDPSEKVKFGSELVTALNERRFEPGLDPDIAASLEHRWLMADLLDFHAREDAVTSFEYFQSINKSEGELMDDPNAIAGLQFVSELETSVPGGRQKTYKAKRVYRFDPNQLTKIDASSEVKATNFYRPKLSDSDPGGPNVTLESLDIDAGLVTLTVYNREDDLPHPTAIFDHKNVNKTGFVKALNELGAEVLRDSRTHRASHDILHRVPPRFVSQSVVAANAAGVLDDEVLAGLIGDLDASYLVIQGPPGTGKTYSSARAILRLIAAGHTIGIAANTHSAVEQLLFEMNKYVEEFGFSQGSPLRVAQRSKSADVAYEPSGSAMTVTFASDNDKAAAAVKHHHVVAGTSFLFTSEAMRDSLDILFIDEAGQLSLADTLGASLSARNIVLVGDPQQLKQPTKAAHPGQSGLSGLEYINQDADVVPPEYGVLLNKTRRMHPSITDFISEQVYESKLGSDDACARQCIGGDDAFSGYGLRWLPVEHTGRSTYSPEECAIVVDTYYRMLGRPFTNSKGEAAPMTCEDIFVIAPYNHQVQKLRQGLLAHPDAARHDVTDELVRRRVGTVDKAQGDEAPVVIISYASSSAVDVPRGMEFHYSKNRFNVAVSRAKALAIVVANPRLLDVACQTIDQVKLANMLCRYAEVATPISGPERRAL
jgi:predicted RecB family nuclease